MYPIPDTAASDPFLCCHEEKGRVTYCPVPALFRYDDNGTWYCADHWPDLDDELLSPAQLDPED